MSEGTILVVEDDASIARFVELELRHQGFVVERASDGATALEMVANGEPDLIVLDLMLPGIEGLEVARTLRGDGFDRPILMLTARSDTRDVVAGFEAGADDYVRKPFEMPELLSRVRALLHRSVESKRGGTISASGIEVDLAARSASKDGLRLDLTGREYELLAYLVGNAGRVVTREEIIRDVWGGQRSTDSNVIEVFMCHLRGKIGDRSGRAIQTIRGVGYFFARN